MTTQPASPLPMLIELAQKEVDDCARKLASTLAQQQQSEKKLLVLLNYRQEYQDKLSHHVQRGIGHTDLRNFGTFLGKLTDAITQQQNELQHWQQGVQQAQQQWQLAQRKLKSFGVLEERREHKETIRLQRFQQKQNDEFAARAMRQQSAHKF